MNFIFVFACIGARVGGMAHTPKSMLEIESLIILAYLSGIFVIAYFKHHMFLFIYCLLMLISVLVMLRVVSVSTTTTTTTAESWFLLSRPITTECGLWTTLTTISVDQNASDLLSLPLFLFLSLSSYTVPCTQYPTSTVQELFTTIRHIRLTHRNCDQLDHGDFSSFNFSSTSHSRLCQWFQ